MDFGQRLASSSFLFSNNHKCLSRGRKARVNITLMLPTLNDAQLDRLSEICADIGQVFFASMVVTPLLTGVDKLNLTVVIFGLPLSIVSWLLSVTLAREK